MQNISAIIKKEEATAKKLLWVLGRHAFLVMLILIAAILVITVILFYNYVILVEAKNPQDSSVNVRFNAGTYEKILKTWEANRKNAQDSKSYTNPFAI